MTTPKWPVKPSIVVAGLAVAVAAWLSSCSKSDPAPQVQAQAAQPAAFQPEEVLRSKPNNFACVSRETLEQAIGHSVAHEKTKFAAMFERADCMPLPEGATFKVLHAERTVLEIVSTNSTRSEGVWTYVEALSR